MLECCVWFRIENESTVQSTVESLQRQRDALGAFLTISATMLQIALHTQELAESSYPPSEMAAQVLLTLYFYSNLSQPQPNVMEGHQLVFSGFLDILANGQHLDSVAELFRATYSMHRSPAEAAFVLQLGELLVHQIDADTLARYLMPLCR
jgi:hypothetical protein